MGTPRTRVSLLAPPGDAWLASLSEIPGVTAWRWSAELDRVETTAAGAPMTLEDLAAQVHEDDRPHWREIFGRARERGEAWLCCFRATPGGGGGWVEERGRAWLDPNGHPDLALALRLGVALTGGDAALERGELAARARHQDPAATIARDLRPPLAALIAQAKVLGRRAEAPAVTRSRIASIVGNAQHMAAMLSELAESSLLESGGLRLELRSLDIGELLRGTRGRLRVPGDGRRRISIDLPHGTPRILADPVRIERALLSLLGAALTGSAPDASIAVRVSAVAGWIAIDVMGAGGAGASGAPPRRQPASRAAREQAALGLVTARMLVHAHGGTLEAGETAGADPVFRVRLPLRPPEP